MSSTKKFLIFCGIIFSIVAIIVVLGLVTTSNRKKTETTKTEPEVVLKEKTKVSFDSVQNLEVVGKTELDLNTEVLFLPSNQVAYLNKDKKLYINDSVRDDTNSFAPTSMFYNQDGFIINHTNNPFVIENTAKNAVNLPEDIVSMVPANPKGYNYLTINPDGSFSIKYTDTIRIGANQESLATINPVGKYPNAELKSIGNSLYALFTNYDGTTIEIWQYENKNVRKIKDLTKVGSFKSFDNFILFTDELEIPTDLTKYKVNVLDLSSPSKPFLQELSWSQALGQVNVYGDPQADRCSYDNVSKLYCLVKKEDIPDDQADYKDVIFTYDIKTKKIDFPYKDVTISASRIHVSPKKEVYLTAQDTGLLYKFTK
jgi:hypothetical protein